MNSNKPNRHVYTHYVSEGRGGQSEVLILAKGIPEECFLALVMNAMDYEVSVGSVHCQRNKYIELFLFPLGL